MEVLSVPFGPGAPGVPEKGRVSGEVKGRICYLAVLVVLEVLGVLVGKLA